MQQYRVNFSLLIGLLVGTVVCSGAVYGLWRFQIDRNAGALLSDADKAVEEGDYREAVRYYSNYISVRGGDEARVKLANAFADLAEQDDVAPEEFATARAVLENTVRLLPDATALQKRLAEFYYRFGLYKDALEHLGYLIEKDPDSVELKVMQAEYLDRAGEFDKAIDLSFKLIGYDPEADTFDVEKALAPHEVDVYTNLAAGLRRNREQPALADRVIDQLIEVNPDSAAAHLYRGHYLIGTERREAGTTEVHKAYELAPQDADVLMSMARLESQPESINYDKARGYLETGKKLFPDDIRFYQALATLDTAQKDYDKAMEEVNEGLEAVAGQKARVLLLFKSDLQARAHDIEGMRQTVDDMRKVQFRPEYIDWTEAQILLVQRKWFEASEALFRLRSRVEDMADVGVQVDVQLGLCYEQLGRFDLALQQYNLVLQNHPQNGPAAAGQQRVKARMGLPDETAGTAEHAWQRALTEELQKPKAERDWARMDEAINQAAEAGNVTGVNLVLLRARLKLAQEDFAAARQLLREANKMDSENLQAYQLLVQAARFDPNQGPEVALTMLDKVVKKFGDRPPLRLDKADLYIAIHGDQLPDQLAALAEPSEDWTEDEKVTVWNGLATKCVSLGLSDQARMCWNRVADILPSDLPTRRMLFNLALEANDDAEMEAAENKILEIVQDKQDSGWLYTEAQRLLSQVRRGKLPKETTSQIQELIDRAMDQRPEWADLYLVQAELDLFEGDVEDALAAFDRAEELGRLSVSATVQHIRLLVQRERFRQARELAERLSVEGRRRLLGQMYSEILLRTNDAEAAIAEARAIVDADPENAQNQLWYGQLLGRASQSSSVSDSERAAHLKSATEAVAHAVQIEPQLVDGWYLLLSYHLIQKERELALEVLRNAQLTLSSDLLPQFLAKSYQALGYWFDAENMYRLQYENAPDDAARAKQLATFYLSRVYQLKDGPAKASPLINQILRAGAEGKLATDDPDLQWARRQGAELLAAQNDYQQLLKAENLLASNFQAGYLSAQDQLQMAHILASRPEPESRVKATQLFEAVAAEQPLDPPSELMLGRMYFALGDWAKCQTQMQKTISRFPDMTSPRDAYVRMLLQHGDRRDLSDAERQLRRLQQLAPGHSRVIELTVRLGNKRGKQDQIRTLLKRLSPQTDNASDITDEQLPLLEMVSGLLVDVGELDDAERVYRLLAARYPRYALPLAVFLGQHGDVDDCFKEFDKIYAIARLPQMIDAATSVLRARRDEVGDKYDQQVQAWIDRVLRDDPDSISALMLQSNFYEVQQKYDEAAALYRRLLARDDLTGPRRAVVLNNLSFLIALSRADASAGAEALKLVQEAAQILGPTADVLDTRAVAYIASDDYRHAIDDMELSVLDNPTPSKYFHKAVAHLLAGENKAAIESWEKAEELAKAEEPGKAEEPDLIRKSLNRIEFDQYEKTKAKIDELRTQNSL
jgi:tetratricopeptide (TPR) repeat protein